MITTTDKLDLRKEDPGYYTADKQPELKDLDAYYYLVVTGRCDPQSEPFLRAIEKLYAVAYAIKFICKAEDMDFVVPKMEGYWWIDGGLQAQKNFTQTPPDHWNWKIVIRMPDFVEGDHYYRAIQKLRMKDPEVKADTVRFELINEGLCVQCLHLGSYHEEESTIARIIAYTEANDLVIHGYHHEIYLNDPRKTAENKLKTILRYAVKKAK